MEKSITKEKKKRKEKWLFKCFSEILRDYLNWYPHLFYFDRSSMVSNYEMKYSFFLKLYRLASSFLPFSSDVVITDVMLKLHKITSISNHFEETVKKIASMFLFVHFFSKNISDQTNPRLIWHLKMVGVYTGQTILIKIQWENIPWS